jgi:ribosomal protein S18 acetylase RimI-like enzyme
VTGPSRTLTLRHPTIDDQPRLAAAIDDWFGGRRVRHLVDPAFFLHFASTSWLASANGRRHHSAGVLLGYRSQDRPHEAVLHLVAVDPAHRRRGIGRTLVQTFVDDCHRAAIDTVTAVAWPDDRIALAFFRALGFLPGDGPGSGRLYGVPAVADYAGPGEDRTILVRRIQPAT